MRRLAAALERDDARVVMHELWTGHAFLERAVEPDGTKRGKLAIISYRVIPSESDAFTLDADAFDCAVRAARRAGVDYLWLDCWALSPRGLEPCLSVPPLKDQRSKPHRDRRSAGSRRGESMCIANSFDHSRR